MKLLVPGFLLFLFTGLGSCSTMKTNPDARQKAFNYEASFGKTFHSPYLLYLPPSYDSLPGQSFPLIVFLHGSGERGHQIEWVKKNGLPALLEKEDLPFVVLSPQCPSNTWWDPDLVVSLTRAIIKKYRIDEDRIYLTGLSMGGLGVWETAMRYPGIWAAIAPVCGPGLPLRTDLISHLPVWIFHGEDDPVVSPDYSREMAKALRSKGAEVKISLYPGVGHDAWVQAYADAQLYEWFLMHQRKGNP